MATLTRVKDFAKSPATILRLNFGRKPLRCDQGPVRNCLAKSQANWGLVCKMISLVPFSYWFPQAHEDRNSVLRTG